MQENVESIKKSENELKKLSNRRSMMKLVVEDLNELSKDKNAINKYL